MRFRIVFAVVMSLLLAHCGDSPVEPVVEHNLPSFATTTTDDGLSISTDKDDYQPGDAVHFTGYGWQPGDVLDIVLTDNPETEPPHTWSVTVDDQGMFHDSTYVVDQGDLNVSFTLVATSRVTGRSLTVNFTDSQPQSMTLNPTTATVTQGGSAVYNVSVTVNGNNNNCTMTLSAAPLPTGASASFSGGATITTNASFTKTLTIATLATTPTGSTNFTVSVAKGADCQSNSSPPSATGTLVVQAPADQTPPTVTINQAAAQADPTNTAPINYTVIFSENVT